MPALTHKSIDAMIHAAAIAKGFADTSIVAQHIRDRAGVMDHGDWFLLSVKFHEGADWELLGRRRTKSELLQMLNSKPAVIAAAGVQ